MSAICPVCVNRDLRGQVDADVVRRLTLSNIAQKHGLSSRAVRRHVGHLPEKLEGEASATRPTVYIGSINISVFVDAPEEGDVVADDQGLLDPEEGVVGSHG
jgi:hypothetical protein